MDTRSPCKISSSLGMVWLLSLLVLMFTTTSADTNDTTTTTNTPTTTTTNTPTTKPYQKCILTGTLDGRKMALDKAYSASKVLDIVFIIDRSKSIGNITFNRAKTFISSLIQYQVRTGAITIHPDHSRISLMSFGKQATVIVDGIKDGTFDACVFEDKLSSVNLDNSAQTQPAYALERAKSIFETSPRKGKSKAIMWVFSDGDFDDEDDDNRTINRQNAINDLYTAGVEVFVVGEGAWLNSAEREENLRTIATATTHYLCVEDWQLVVSENGTTPRAEAESRSPIYGLPISSKMNGCQECGSSETCACEVTQAIYTCVDCSEDNVNREQYKHVCPPVEDSGQWWLLYAFIGAGILGFLLLVLIVICLCLCARRRTRVREPNGIPVLPLRKTPKHPGPPLPPPPVPRRPGRDPETADLDVYSNTVDRDIGQRDRRRPDPDMYSTTVDGDIAQTDRRRADLDIYSNVNDDSSSGQTNVDTGGHRTPSGYSYVPDNEKDMPGWAAYLTAQKEENNIDHLGVFSVNGNHWAFTQGFHIPPAEIKALDSAFRVGPEHQGNQIRVAGNRYNLDKAEVSELHLHGSRPKKANGRTYQESVWVAKSGDYIIIGVAKAENDCNNVVFELYRNLATSEQAIDEED